MQEKAITSALAMELHFFCIDPSIYTKNNVVFEEIIENCL